MTNKFSVQFERFNNDPEKLLCNALRLSEAFCKSFPITTESGYIAYSNPTCKEGLPDQEFWFAVVEAKQKEDAYRKAVDSLLGAELEKPFPIQLRLVDDDVFKL